MKNAIIATDAGISRDDIVMANTGAVADFHVAIDDGIGTDRNVRAKLGSRIDDGGGMDTHGSGRGIKEENQSRLQTRDIRMKQGFAVCRATLLRTQVGRPRWPSRRT